MSTIIIAATVVIIVIAVIVVIGLRRRRWGASGLRYYPVGGAASQGQEHSIDRYVPYLVVSSWPLVVWLVRLLVLAYFQFDDNITDIRYPNT
jgi:hypothetical protein